METRTYSNNKGECIIISIFEFAQHEGFELTPEQQAYLMSKFSKKEIFIHFSDVEREVADRIYNQYKETFNLD